MYYLYLNNNVITSTIINYNSNSPSGTRNTGTIVIAMQLHPNDSVMVKNSGGTGLYSSIYSTLSLTIVQVK